MAEHGSSARSSPPTQDHRRAARGEVISDRQRTQNYANAIGGNARAITKAGLVYLEEGFVMNLLETVLEIDQETPA
jgi:hypothetical protein